MEKTFWDRIAGAYDLAERLNAKAMHRMVGAIQRMVPARAAVLECAAGTGMISAALAPQVRSVCCTDLSLAMLDRARRKCLGRGNVTFAARDLTHLPEHDGMFDAVIAANVLHLLDEPQNAVRELYRVTKPGGVLILPTFLQGEMSASFGAAVRLYRVLGFAPRYEWTDPAYTAMLCAAGMDHMVYWTIPGRCPIGLAVIGRD